MPYRKEVGAERLLVEKNASRYPKRGIEVIEGVVGIIVCVDAKILQNLSRNCRICVRRTDVDRAAKCQQRSTIKREFIALGVPAKVIVIVEYQDTGSGVDVTTINMSCGEAADTGADNDQVVVLTGRVGRPLLALDQRMRDFERPRVRSAHPGRCRRIMHCNRR